jgi:hypothetical protein
MFLDDALEGFDKQSTTSAKDAARAVFWAYHAQSLLSEHDCTSERMTEH